MKRKFLILIPLILFIIGIPLLAQNKLETGTKAPDFSLPCIGSEKPMVLSDYVDKKIVIVHFWKSR